MLDIANVLKMRVDIADEDSVVDRITQLSRGRRGSYICLSNVHMCMEAYDSIEFQRVVNNADLVLADGRPIYWAQKLLGARQAKQVRGQDLMERVCMMSAQKTFRVGLYGGATEEVLNRTIKTLELRYPNIDIVYTYVPPFRKHTPEEDKRVVEAINAAEIDVLFVGIGCPKQEYWMASHKDRLNCVMLGVGAAFDFVAGSKRHAPKLLQFIGMEWSYRLATEPKRLAKRYMKHNPRFLFHFIRQWLFKKKYAFDLEQLELEGNEHA